MTNTKKIVQAAMFIAIIGALLIINREFAFIFDYLVNILVSVVIVAYVVQFDFKSGVMMSVGMMVVTLLFGSFYSYLYMPLSIIAGLTYAYVLDKQDSYPLAILWTVLVYVFGETILSCLVLPLMGFGDFNEFFMAIKEMFDSIGLIFAEDTLLRVCKLSFVVGAAFTGFLEGILIHLVAIIIFKKFRIKAIPAIQLDKLILPQKAAYLCFILCFGFIVANYFLDIDVIYYTIMIGAVLGAIVLVMQGAVYVLTYGVLVKRRNYGIFLVLFTILFLPYSIIILMFMGFLYASGPLLHHMNRKRGF